jgi:hypothetical protein
MPLATLRFVAAVASWALPILLAPVAARLRARHWRLIAATILVGLPQAAPLLLGHRWPLGTFLAAVYSGILGLKMVDLFGRAGPIPSYGRALIFLSFWPSLDRDRVMLPLRIGRARIVAGRLGRAAVDLAIGLAFLAADVAHGRMPGFDYVLGLFEILFLGQAANHLMIAGFALIGYQVDDAFRYPVLARSILDFWSRYNVWIHRWLKRHVFDRVGGRRRPTAAILATFAVSGLLHEYLIVVALPDLIGRQLAFFLLHGFGGIAGARLGRVYRARRGRPVPWPLGAAAALTFMIATGYLFVSCLDRIVHPAFATQGPGQVASSSIKGAR